MTRIAKHSRPAALLTLALLVALALQPAAMAAEAAAPQREATLAITGMT